MAQRVAAIFDSRAEAERAADALVDLGAERDQISLLARGEEGADAQSSMEQANHGDGMVKQGDHGEGMVEPAREVGDSGAALTTTDGGDVAQGATIGAVAGIAAGLLALTVPGIGLVLAAGPLAMAAASGAIAGGVFGGLRDIGINEHHAQGYEEHVRGGGVLLTGVIPHANETQVRAVLEEHGGHDISFHELATADAAPAATAPMMATPPAAATDRAIAGADITGTAPAPRRDMTAADEIRVPVTEETAQVRKEQRQVGEVAVSKSVDVETEHISEPVTRTRVDVERRAVPAGQEAAYDERATPLTEGDTIRVPIVEEELVVEKVPRVTGEVVIRKETETRQVEQDVELRRERVDVDQDTDEEEEVIDRPAAARPSRGV